MHFGKEILMYQEKGKDSSDAIQLRPKIIMPVFIIWYFPLEILNRFFLTHIYIHTKRLLYIMLICNFLMAIHKHIVH